MTEQMLDRLVHQGYEHFIYAISGEGLSSPKDFGLLPKIMSTACYRGYYMVYICDNHNLYLRDMTVYAETYPSIEKFSQYRNAYDLWGTTTYTGLSPVSSFMGGLIIGRNLRRGKEVPKYLSHWLSSRTIIELKFKEGVVQEEIDHSEEIDLRLNRADLDWRQLREDMFSVEYDFTYPWTLAYGKRSPTNSKRSIMADDLLAVLEQTLVFVSSSHQSSLYICKEPLEKELSRQIENIRTNKALNKGQLIRLFAPTGPIQELSIHNNWAEEFIEIAGLFDDYIDNRNNLFG